MAPIDNDVLAAGDLDRFNETGWLITDTLDGYGLELLRSWVDAIEGWPVDGDGWMQHFEMTDAGPRLCRSENLIPFHDGLRHLLTVGPMVEMASALIRSQAVLYKEKINYKLPGGAGYAPHQDAPAYPFINSHVSCMIAVDDSDQSNGCLEVVSGCHRGLLETDATGCISKQLVEDFTWEPAEVRAGQTLWFHSLTPHRSSANVSDKPRRALYPTYNALSEGNLRDDYYEHKLAAFDSVSDDTGRHSQSGQPLDRVRVSLIGDFQGRPVQ